MTFSPRSCHVLKLGTVVFLVTATLYYLFFQDQFGVRGIHDAHDVYQVAVTGKKGTFVEDLLDNEIDGPFDDGALAALCSSKKWTPGLIFKCEAPQGGIGNVRNVFMNCVRYAIEAGATGFIIPEITVRGPSLTALHTERLVPFSYFFDHNYFKSSLHNACPRMHIYNHPNDLWDMPSTAPPVWLIHPQLSNQSHPQAETIMLDPSKWNAHFFSKLNRTHPTKFTDTRPVLVSLNRPLLQWPIQHDEPAFIATFGRIFRFREDVRRLAATVLYAMNKRYNLDIDPEAPGIQEGKFYGAHLRTAADAVAAGWTPYDVQSEHYLSHAAHNHLSLIYVASGSSPDIATFGEEAAAHSPPMEVVTKSMLLEGKGFEREKDEMSRLTTDQQGLVDYEVMLRASRFGGTWESSYGWNLAMRRHVTMGKGTWISLPGGKATAGGALSGLKGSSEASTWNHPATIQKPAAETEAEGEIDLGTELANSTGTPAIASPSPTVYPLGQGRRSLDTKTPRRQLPTGQQSFSDTYSIIFGDVTPGDHPGLVFELALWP